MRRAPRWAVRTFLAACGGLLLCAAAASGDPTPPHSEIPVTSQFGISHTLYMDPDPHTITKEFAFFYNTVPDTGVDRYLRRDLFHLIYQRSGGPQAQETLFGHAWSQDLVHWVVDTAAFAVDTTGWNVLHVWAPSLVEVGDKVYLFYTGVDANNDQSIGYASTSLLDTTNTVWDPARVQVWTAAQTKWAVPDPPIYFGQTQLRDPFVMADPDSAGRLLMFYSAHDSVDLKLGLGGTAIGVARSLPGTVNEWQDLGYYPSSLRSVTNVPQLEGPHAFSAHGSGSGWRLMFTNAGSPPGENGNTTIRFEQLAPEASLADTTPAHWGPPVVLKSYLGGNNAVFGWSGSESLHVPGADYLAGFTAWGPFKVGIAITRMIWGETDFTVGTPSVTSVDEVHSAARGVRMSLTSYTPHARTITFALDAPLALDARLEVFDALGRRVATPFAGKLPKGRSSVSWQVRGAASGVYFARLSFAGGVRAAAIPIVR